MINNDAIFCSWMSLKMAKGVAQVDQDCCGPTGYRGRHAALEAVSKGVEWLESNVIPGVAETNPGVAMWTPTTRKQHIRETSRYQTDVTDEE
jgi:hypothetical protein